MPPGGPVNPDGSRSIRSAASSAIGKENSQLFRHYTNMLERKFGQSRTSCVRSVRVPSAAPAGSAARFQFALVVLDTRRAVLSSGGAAAASHSAGSGSSGGFVPPSDAHLAAVSRGKTHNTPSHSPANTLRPGELNVAGAASSPASATPGSAGSHPLAHSIGAGSGSGSGSGSSMSVPMGSPAHGQSLVIHQPLHPYELTERDKVYIQCYFSLVNRAAFPMVHEAR